MRSIRTRLLLVTMAAILVCVLSIGSMAIYFIRLEGERDSDRELKLLCENKCKTLDEYLNSIEQSVNLISGYTQELLGGTESAEEKSDEANPEGNSESARNDLTAASLQRYSEQLNVLCRSAAGDTNGIEACYYQFDPDIGGTGYGYLYTKAEDGSFVGREMAEMTAQDLNNSEQYGWYSVPREQGRACWLAPYDKESLVNLAGGMATYEHGTDKNVNDVLKRADEQMYRNKAEYKKSRL